MPSSPSFAIFGLTLSGVATSVLSTALSTAQSTAGDGRDRKEGADAEAAAPAGLREALLSALVWPATLTVPLVLHRREVYTRLLPRRLYEEPVELGGAQLRPPLGLALGIGAVVVGQVATIAYHYARRARLLGTPTAVQVRRRARPPRLALLRTTIAHLVLRSQAKGARSYEFAEGVGKCALRLALSTPPARGAPADRGAVAHSHVANPEGLLMCAPFARLWTPFRF